MKKILFTLLTILMVIVSCAKIDIVPDTYNSRNENVEIVFGAHAGKGLMTRAVINGDTLPDGSEFGVYSYYAAGTNHLLIDNGHYAVNKDTARATGGEKYYWPKSDNNNVTKDSIDFLAIYPYSTTDYSRSGNTVTITLNASTTDSTSTKDVLYAIADNQYHQTVGTYNNTTPNKYYVPLTFKHALTLVEFQGKHAGATNNIDTITVTEIAFLNSDGTAYAIYTGGSISFDISKITATTKPDTTFTGGTTNNTLNFANNCGLTSSKYTTISKAIMVPQAVPNKVRITYNITIKNTNGEKVEFTGRQVVKEINTGSDMTNNTPRNYVSNWYSGKHYVYRYYITAEAIEFTVTVDDWDLPDGWQIWDHDVASYVDRFFEKASTIMGNCIEVQNHIMA